VPAGGDVRRAVVRAWIEVDPAAEGLAGGLEDMGRRPPVGRGGREERGRGHVAPPPVSPSGPGDRLQSVGRSTDTIECFGIKTSLPAAVRITIS